MYVKYIGSKTILNTVFTTKVCVFILFIYLFIFSFFFSFHKTVLIEIFLKALLYFVKV